jgi:hypothetical protein
VAHAGFLREGRCALSPRDRKSAEEAIVGSCGKRTLANRLAADESRGVIGECVIQCPMPLPLHILQLLFVQPEIVAQFMDDSQADLFADFGLA